MCIGCQSRVAAAVMYVLGTHSQPSAPNRMRGGSGGYGGDGGTVPSVDGQARALTAAAAVAQRLLWKAHGCSMNSHCHLSFGCGPRSCDRCGGWELLCELVRVQPIHVTVAASPDWQTTHIHTSCTVVAVELFLLWKTGCTSLSATYLYITSCRVSSGAVFSVNLTSSIARAQAL